MTLALAPRPTARHRTRGWRGPTEARPFPSLGWAILDWTYAYLPSPADEKKPLIYTDEQARRIVRWYEVDPVTCEFPWLRLVLEEAKGYGKALALDTPIPTPAGWTTMGEIRVGDEVLDDRGYPTRVVGAFDTALGHECYAVTTRRAVWIATPRLRRSKA